MNNQKIKIDDKCLALFFLVFVVLVVSGCVEEKNKGMTVEELKTKLIASSNSVKSYSFEGKITVESMGVKVDVPVNGKVDISNKRSYMSTEMMGRKTEMYIVNNIVYMKNMGVWSKISKKAGFDRIWEQSNHYNENIKLLRDAKTEIVGEEDVRGEKCYVLKVTPDIKKFFSRMMSQSGRVNEEEMKGVEDSIKEMSVKFWISEKTSYISKTEMLMKMNIGVSGNKAVNMKVVMEIYDYNKPLIIEPPQEALNAVEFEFEMPS